MRIKKYNLYRSVVAVVVFLIALTVYSLTVEPTVSFWDCGEYISTSAKLEVGHPPGAPFFQMMGAVFALFAKDADSVAFMVNMMSVLSSAFTILFLYLIITNLVRKITFNNADDKVSALQAISVIGSGVVGSLAYAFSDSFWFNAVEAEVYAMAMLFLSAMFWLGLKWTDRLNTPGGDKWLLLIGLVVGLSFGVHFMALLTIPAIGMLYFFKSNYAKTPLNFIIANIVSVAILLLIFKLILPYTLAYFGYMEVFFVNSLSLPFNSGTIVAGISVIVLFVFLLMYAYKKNLPVLEKVVLFIGFVLIGFSSWLMIPIRANADTIINENSPTDARLLLAYYNMEQYPETHLLYGPMYSDQYAGMDANTPYVDDKPKYERDYKQNKYIIVNNYKSARVAPNDAHMGFFPRMWSSDHAANYMRITGVLPFKVKPEYATSEQLQQVIAEFDTKVKQGEIGYEGYARFLSQYKDYIDVEKPSFWQNVKYWIFYQIHYMYIRYFMWNFVGRQDDIQGKFDNHGNWLSGITFIDQLRLGSQQYLPSDVLNNKARNLYYFLPLLLGCIGLLYHYSKSQRSWWVVFVMFMFTGLALKVYLNERPFEPRERDYALVGSFFTFSIWIGMGVGGLIHELTRRFNSKWVSMLIVMGCLISVPGVMAYQNWDDHDRSGRYTAEAVANAYLDSVDEGKGAILFTIGDNDTFLLWYAQEIEAKRTDVRTINTSLLATDWYIDQMKRKAYDSEPIPSQLKHAQYAFGVRDAIYYHPRTESRWNIKDFMNWISSDDPKTKMKFANGQEVVYYPTNKIRVYVNKENVLKSGVVKPEDADKIVEYIDIDLPKSGIGKNRMMMLDILANNDWKRPIYFTGGSMNDEEYIWMKDYLQLDGLVYKLVPIRTPVSADSPYDLGRIDSEKMYQIVKHWQWGGMENPKVYHDPETRKNSIAFRGNISRLVEQLINEGKVDKAKEMLDLVTEKLPLDLFGYYFTIEPIIDGYYKVQDQKQARNLFFQVAQKYQQELNYYAHMSSSEKQENYDNIEYCLRRYIALISILYENKDETFHKEQEQIFKTYLDNFIA